MSWLEDFLIMIASLIGLGVIIFICTVISFEMGLGLGGAVLLTFGVVFALIFINERHNKYRNKQEELRLVQEEELQLAQEEKNHIKYFNGIKTLQDAYNLSPTEFEVLIKHLFEKYGYEAELTSATGDGGIDLYLYKEGKTEIVQCKRYNSSISVQPVREFFGVMVDQQISKGYIITTSNFTLPAQKFAQGKGIDLIDGDTLAEMLLE